MISAGSLLTADQVAQRWQVSKSHVYRLAREGVIPTVALGRYYRFQIEAIAEFERGGGTRAQSAA